MFLQILFVDFVTWWSLYSVITPNKKNQSAVHNIKKFRVILDLHSSQSQKYVDEHFFVVIFDFVR